RPKVRRSVLEGNRREREGPRRALALETEDDRVGGRTRRGLRHHATPPESFRVAAVGGAGGWDGDRRYEGRGGCQGGDGYVSTPVAHVTPEYLRIGSM